MPFDARSLTPLVTSDSFTLWQYDTSDSRAAVLAPGYFAADNRLQQGHLLILRAADAMALIPVRAAAAVGNGLVLDSSPAPIRVQSAAAMSFGAMMRAAATSRGVMPDAMPASVAAGSTLSLGASVAGTSRVNFAVVDASGSVVSGPVTAIAANGRAAASLPAPAVGSGYRVRAADAADAALAGFSTGFAVVAAQLASILAAEDGGVLLAESRDRLAA